MNINKLLALLLSFFLCLPAYAGIGADGSGSGSGAATTESFITVGNSSSLANERAIAVDTGLTGTDGGAGGFYTIGLGSVLTYFLNTGATTQQAAVNAILQFSGVTAGDIVYYNGTNWVRLAKGSNGTFLGIDGSGNLAYGSPAGSGTVSSVGVVAPSWLTSSGGPITGSGDITLANGTGLSNYYVVATNGSGALDLRALAADHIPALDVAKITSGAFAKARQHASTVYNDASNTYSTGAQDMSAAGVTFKIPTDAPASGGLIAYRSNKLAWHNGSTVINAANEARAINTTSPLSGGGDLSADRTLSLTTVPATLGGTGQSTCVKGDIFIGDTSANTVTKLAIGSTGQVPTVSGGTLVYATPASGGLFKASAITATVRTLPTSGALSGTYIHSGPVTSTGTYTFTHDTRVYIKGTWTIGHTLTGTAQSNGGDPQSFYSIGRFGSGPSGGGGGVYQYGGGGGGGNGGAGGRGASGASPYDCPSGGRAMAVWGTGGSGGGSGAGSGTSGQPGQNGGGGGAFLLIEADGDLVINETISANGANGSVATSTGGAGGGGSGGDIDIRCTGALTLASAKKIQANGGNGGNYTGSGLKAGGGGGGKVRTWSGGSTTLTGSLESLAGSKGTGTAGTVDAADGSAGTTETIQSTAPISLF